MADPVDLAQLPLAAEHIRAHHADHSRRPHLDRHRSGAWVCSACGALVAVPRDALL